MDSGLLLPVKMKLTGLDADRHLVDAIHFGKSVEGTAKLYNQSIFFFETGELPGRRSSLRIKLYVGAPKEGSVFLAFHSLMVAKEMAVYPELWGKIANWLIPKIITATWQKLLNKPDETEKIIQFVQEESQRNREFAAELSRMAIGAVVQDKSRLHETVEKLADASRHGAELMVSPVGRTCSLLTQRIGEDIAIEIDEPSAEVIRSKNVLEVTEVNTYECQIEGVDKTNGSCRVLLPNRDKPVIGKITDPQLENIGNIYTHALDQDLKISVTAKATLKDGEIQKLYISDAKSL